MNLTGYSDEDSIEDTHVTDFLANIMHFCQRKNLDFSSMLRMAETHFQEEIFEEKQKVEDNAI